MIIEFTGLHWRDISIVTTRAAGRQLATSQDSEPYLHRATRARQG